MPDPNQPAPAPADLPVPMTEETVARDVLADSAEYFNATRDIRYKYLPTRAVRMSDLTGVKGEVYLDGFKLGNFLRVEYGGERLNANARRMNRILGKTVIGEVKLWTRHAPEPVSMRSPLYFCKWTRAYQLEIWECLETPSGTHHSFRVLDFMGSGGSITKHPDFSPVLADLDTQWSLSLEMREGGHYQPYGYTIGDEFAAWDSLELPRPTEEAHSLSVGPIHAAARVPPAALQLVL